MTFSLLASTSRRTPSTSIIVNSFASPIVVQQRTATKRGAGSTRNNKDSAGRRLGLKKSGGQQVVPGNIIVRQRGFEWHPGQHVGAGKDHTLFALEPGFVQFYKAMKKPGSTSTSPKMVRKYCGITLTRDEKLPRDEASLGRSRRFPHTNLTRVEAALEGFKQAREDMRTGRASGRSEAEQQQAVDA